MKNAYVLVDHHGDNGTVSTGMILKDVEPKRFGKLEKSGLVREATVDELKAGYQPPFTAEGEIKAAAEPANKAAARPANK